ncbi:MAG: hypothetical protein WCG97_03785 [bacterium]
MKKKTLNILVINFIGTCVIWSGYFYIIHNVNKINGSFDDIKHKILFAMKKQDAVNKLRSQVQSNASTSSDLKSFIINPDQTADVVQMIEGFGPVTGTKVSTQTVSTEESTGLPSGADFLKVVFDIDGSKQNVMNCIRLVENMPYNIKINKLIFAKTGDASSTPKWTANVDMVLVKFGDVQAPTTQ